MKVQLKSKSTLEAHTKESLNELSRFKQNDIINIEVVKPKRTQQQNKYLWKVFEILSDITGYTKDEIKNKILVDVGHYRDYVDEETGRIFTIIKPTRFLKKNEFSELTESILKWSAERGFNILTPEEYLMKLN